MGSKTHVFLSRLSPLHKGHQAIIEALSQKDNPLVLIGSSNNIQERTPFTYHQRKKCLRTLYPHLKVLPLPDVGKTEQVFHMTAEKWLDALEQQAKAMNTHFVFYGGSKEDLKFLSRRFETKEISRQHIPISSTMVRQALRENNIEKLKEMLDEKIIHLVVRLYDFQRAQISSQDYSSVRPYHWICRENSDSRYPQRFQIADENLIPWEVTDLNYRPVAFCAGFLTNADWSQTKAHKKETFQKNHERSFEIEEKTGRPLNPMGRTGLSGRGVLRQWGPNHAVHALIYRDHQCKELLQIQRQDNTWALPGAFVNKHEKNLQTTLARKISEVCGADIPMKDSQIIYQGYVDDPRNTDNAWAETTVYLQKLPESFGNHCKAGDEVQSMRWLNIDQVMTKKDLYSAHQKILNYACYCFFNETF